MTTETIIRYTMLTVNTVMAVTFVACIVVNGYGLVRYFWRRVTAPPAVEESEAAS